MVRWTWMRSSRREDSHEGGETEDEALSHSEDKRLRRGVGFGGWEWTPKITGNAIEHIAQKSKESISRRIMWWTMWNVADSLMRLELKFERWIKWGRDHQWPLFKKEKKISREEGKSLGVGFRKNGRRELGIANNDNSFEDHFYKRARNGSCWER